MCSGAYAGIGGGSDVGAEAKFGTFCSDDPLVFCAQHLGYDDTRWAKGHRESKAEPPPGWSFHRGEVNEKNNKIP